MEIQLFDNVARFWVRQNERIFLLKIVVFRFSFRLKSRFIIIKLNYLILSTMKYLRISSNLGSKIQICVKVKFCRNWIFWTKLSNTLHRILERSPEAGRVFGSSWEPQWPHRDLVDLVQLVLVQPFLNHITDNSFR